ncbi:50S ribosomal protein L2 [Candidatus Woesearchaeota archaeon]|nr:50S ribosomal protein L2 [Candidatus Woesearchaeota archaeon]
MGKRLITQRRGKGTFAYKSHSHRYKGKITNLVNKETLKGEIFDVIKCPGHTAPLAKVIYENGQQVLIPAPANIRIKDKISIGDNVEINTGNTLPLKNIPEGTLIYNIESRVGKPSFCRSAGSFARVVSKSPNEVVIKFPSKKEKSLNPECRATIGIAAGGGKRDKPFVKAGRRWHAMHAKSKLYPRTSGVAMNAYDHPFGSGRGRHVGKSKIPPRNAPPGRNIGLLHARKTGRGGKKS